MDLYESKGKLWLMERKPGDKFLRECLDCEQHWLDEGGPGDEECVNPDCESNNTVIIAKVVIKEEKNIPMRRP